MKSEGVKTQDVVTIRGSAIVADAVKLMKEKSLQGVVVESRHESDSYGVVTEADVIYKVAAYGNEAC